MVMYPDAHFLEEITMVILPVLTSVLPSTVLGVASYVLTSMALYALAGRRGIGKAWLSWVPVFNVWIIGSLSDQYRYVVKGQEKSKRKILLLLNLAMILMSVIMAVVAGCMVAELISSAVYGLGEDALWQAVMGPLMTELVLLLPMAGLAVAAAVVRYMAMYDIFTSMDPGNSVLFLVLSILFHVTEPFFLFFNRNKDGGMPPRKPNFQEPVCGFQTEERNYL